MVVVVRSVFLLRPGRPGSSQGGEHARICAHAHKAHDCKIWNGPDWRIAVCKIWHKLMLE